MLALVRVAGAVRASWLSYLNGLIGVWLFISAFWLDDTKRRPGTTSSSAP